MEKSISASALNSARASTSPVSFPAERVVARKAIPPMAPPKKMRISSFFIVCHSFDAAAQVRATPGFGAPSRRMLAVVRGALNPTDRVYDHTARAAVSAGTTSNRSPTMP